MEKDRPRIIERTEPASSPEEARQRRSSGMVGVGAVLLFFTTLALIGGGADTPAGAFLIGLLGAALLVGGLVIRR